MFYIFTFFITWIIWLLLADKSRWRELILVGMFASFLGITTDIIMEHYKLWDYHSAKTNPLIAHFFDDFSLYIVIPYLFIQWLPKKRNVLNMVFYFFIWTSISITIEFIFIYFNHMNHHKNWSLISSYIADWFLFWVFYQFHKLFKLEKLSKK